MKKGVFLILMIAIFSQCVSTVKYAQQPNSIFKINEKPNLVVGIVVDQMRYDYLIKFYNKFGNSGFKRLMQDGFMCENAHINYIPTYTAVGHASIYTGTTPSIHGIIANDWFDIKSKKLIYCVADNRYKTIGATNGGAVSPFRLKTTTIADQLKLAQVNKSKVISISLKDRAAILPVGGSADGVYWFRGKKEANFISSSFYMDELPTWVENFNKSGKAKNHLQIWNPLYDISTYTESIADDNNFEMLFKGEDTPTFPHDLPLLMKENGNYNLLKASPFGNTLIVDFAKAAIIGEQLGQKKTSDFLAISFSSTDYIGHQYGLDSKEIEDTYLRLDLDIANLLQFLDEKVGVDKYTLFLTADHAVAPIPSYLKTQKINANYFNKKKFLEQLNTILFDKYKAKNLILNFYSYQITLNKERIKDLKLNYNKVVNTIVNEMISFENVYKIISAKTLQNRSFNEPVLAALQRGYNQKISGDVIIIPSPGTLSSKHKKGTKHGSAYNYDTHVPLLFFGKGIKKGALKRYVPIVDIAPTLSNLLQIEPPNGNVGIVIEEVLK